MKVYKVLHILLTTEIQIRHTNDVNLHSHIIVSVYCVVNSERFRYDAMSEERGVCDTVMGNKLYKKQFIPSVRRFCKNIIVHKSVEGLALVK